MSVGLKNVLNKEKNWKKKTTAKSYDIHQYSKLEDVQKIYILSKKKSRRSYLMPKWHHSRFCESVISINAA